MTALTMVLWRSTAHTFTLTGWGYVMTLTAAWALHWIVRGNE